MRETEKAVRRRRSDLVFQERYFLGDGIDIGSGDVPLSLYLSDFPRMQSVRAWDIGDGDAQLMNDVSDDTYDFVHSSHCLEHLEDPHEALRNWLRILKPGGYLIVTVPDEVLYERGIWPSRFNPDHKWSFAIHKTKGSLPKTLGVVDLLQEFRDFVECERITQLRTHFDDAASAAMDQTLGDAECAIEWVWKKRCGVVQQEKLPTDWLREGFVAEHQEHDDVRAELAYRRACAGEHPSLDAYLSLAHLLTRLKRYDDAEVLWREAVCRVPGKQTRLFQALFLLQLGRFREGFRIREASIADARRTPTLPENGWRRWQGERLDGKSIALWTEFGLGDEIMFSRFAGEFKAKFNADRVFLVCQDPLYPVMKRLSGVDQVFPVSRHSELLQPDYWVFPHSIPVYRTLEIGNIPRDPYLSISDEAKKSWKVRLGLKAGARKIGIVWKGNPSHENDAYRSLPSLEVLGPLLNTPNTTFVSLQKGEGEREALQFAERYANFIAAGQEIEDMADTAAIIANVDLVVSVDTSVAHLAGAMGRPVWLFLPTLCDWRWLLERHDSPWYPHMRIFRQQRLGDWIPVVEKMTLELLRLQVDSRNGEKSVRRSPPVRK